MRAPLLSLSEITQIESAYALGAPTLGIAAEALLARWTLGLRDHETFVRLVFLTWYARAEPSELTGLDGSRLMTIDTLIEEFGGPRTLSAEALFVLATLAHKFPDCFGDVKRWREQSTKLFETAIAHEPSSLVFRNWRWLSGIEADARDPQQFIRRELRARFHGRGSMGDYLVHICGGTAPAVSGSA